MATSTDTRLTHVTLTVDGGIATVVMDRPDAPVNTLGPRVFDDLAAVIGRVESDPEIRGVVWTSAKDDFLVGADIKALDDATDPAEVAAASEAIQDLFDRLDAVTAEHGKPVVAAIRGAALGGGLELAMSCSVRIATDESRTRLGLPEVQLGLLPAGGGTQRMPSLIGIAPALDLILTGRTVGARRALEIGLVDEVVPPELLLDVARARAAGDPAGSRRPGGHRLSPARLRQLALEENPVGRKVLFTQARDRMMKETRGNYPAPPRALEAVQIGVEQGVEAGSAAESRFFGELAFTAESRALRAVFFATRELEKETWVPEGVEPRPVSRLAVLGGGLMGAGIAAVTSTHARVPVRVKEVDRVGVARAVGHVQEIVDGRVAKRRMTAFEGEKALLRVTGTSAWRGFAGVDLVIEAVFEDLEIKRSILREVEAIIGAGAVFASNTSTLPIGAIAEASSRPETVVGMHYFSPVERMPLLEVIVTDATADWALATAVAFGKRQGKTVIVVNDGPGFYTSRVIAPYGTEAMYLLEEGASIEAIDEAMVAWGFPVGPVLLQDEVGIDVAGKVSRIMVDAFGSRMAGPAFTARFVDGERKGRKNRRGFYRYDEDGTRKGVDQDVYSTLGLGPRRKMPREEIQRRVSLAFVNEATRCLEEGILRSPRDGDMGAVLGLGFPPFRGGPFRYVDQLGASAVVDMLDELATLHGERFTPAEMLRESAASGRTFT
jgi:3-hydroxyacyl-CoA dehydrogenase / enoyl-CoA hydratase / 3-hydroxybutyryl-CoA epimerase